ncbi:MAG: PadR family transcriptional regulator [Candidatus Methanoperedens sp.]|nr:PadR family transcriptional regulator [Candidatus Methanoperedens sp.]
MTDDNCHEEICAPECCDMRGMLSFLIMWFLSKRPMYGEEIAQELEKMKGNKPTPGTIYPALKHLQNNGLVTSQKDGRNIIYSLTEKGATTSKQAFEYFCNMFEPVFNDCVKAKNL